MMSLYIAHVRKGEKNHDQWFTHDLHDHLHGVAKKSDEFAQEI